jgi:hypothetical protein
MNFKLPELENRVINSNESMAQQEAILVIEGITYLVIIL